MESGIELLCRPKRKGTFEVEWLLLRKQARKLVPPGARQYFFRDALMYADDSTIAAISPGARQYLRRV